VDKGCQKGNENNEVTVIHVINSPFLSHGDARTQEIETVDERRKFVELPLFTDSKKHQIRKDRIYI
jgi:hypothetical protein